MCHLVQFYSKQVPWFLLISCFYVQQGQEIWRAPTENIVAMEENFTRQK